MLYSASSRLSSASSRCRSRSISLTGGHGQSTAEAGTRRAAARARARTAPADRRSAPRWRRTARRSRNSSRSRARVARPEARAVAVRRRPLRSRGTRPTPRASSSARSKSGTSSVGKDERDRERPRRGAEQRLVQIGIERRELLVGRLLRQLGVRPEPFERPVLRRHRQTCRIAGLQDRCRIGQD